jgi:putative peptidoglycan lipid II flippase
MLIAPLGAVGLALANAVQNSSHALILLVLLRRALPGLRIGSSLVPFLVRTVPAAVIVGGALVAARPAVGGLIGLIVAAGLALALYVALLLALGVAEVRAAVALVRQRVRA